MSDGPRHPAIRASDTERESTIALLRQAVVDGRLTLEEFSDRVGQAQVARTDQDQRPRAERCTSATSESNPGAG